MSRDHEKFLCQIQALGKQMRALEISNLATQLEQLRASFSNESAGPFVFMLAIAQQVLPIKEAYVVPHPLSGEKCWEGSGGWDLVLFGEPTEFGKNRTLRFRTLAAWLPKAHGLWPILNRSMCSQPTSSTERNPPTWSILRTPLKSLKRVLPS